jgi:PncC family amidohydrolase
MTDIPGSSNFLMGSIVSYSNKAKHEILNVTTLNLEKFGAVSEQVAKEMAIGVQALFNVDVGVSITGIAGPGGATKDKPVGLVYIAVIYNKVLVVEKCYFEGTRKEIKMKSAKKAIELAKKNIDENHKEKNK